MLSIYRFVLSAQKSVCLPISFLEQMMFATAISQSKDDNLSPLVNVKYGCEGSVSLEFSWDLIFNTIFEF